MIACYDALIYSISNSRYFPLGVHRHIIKSLLPNVYNKIAGYVIKNALLLLIGGNDNS